MLLNIVCCRNLKIFKRMNYGFLVASSSKVAGLCKQNKDYEGKKEVMIRNK